jgi:hypothetical protein
MFLLYKAAKEPLSYVRINSVGLEEVLGKIEKFKIFTEFFISKKYNTTQA